MEIYGINPVAEALKGGRVTRLRISARADRRMDQILALAATKGIAVERVDAQALDRTVFRLVVESPLHRTSQRPTHAFLGVAQLLVQPRQKHLIEDSIRLRIRQDRERRIDARLHGPLAEQIGAEGVNGADVRFFKVVHRGIQQRIAGFAEHGRKELRLNPAEQHVAIGHGQRAAAAI